MAEKGQNKNSISSRAQENASNLSDFVLDKVIFSNVFDKDIRRIYIYRKSERLAKAIQLITPAFGSAPALRDRLDSIAVGLIDAAILPPSQARTGLSHELLALSSFLSVARTGGLLSAMNADLIAREAHHLLQEIASYEEPRLFLDEVPSLAELAKRAPDVRESPEPRPLRSARSFTDALFQSAPPKGQGKRHTSIFSISEGHTERQEAIIAILQNKGPSYIKDISTVIREVSEKTIQRELQSLVTKGVVEREGERRWTRYSFVG
ncbi:hypothetical protein H0X32_02500 [Patescibacteria group bacterium]|nr:hypothetical protein [Patescibacteria group bacterium]